MEGFVRGDIVVIHFPFTDLSAAKKRPALIIAPLEGDDIIMCQITSKDTKDKYAIPLLMSDILNGSFHYTSNIRPNRIATLDKKLIEKKIARLNNHKFKKVIETLKKIIDGESI